MPYSSGGLVPVCSGTGKSSVPAIQMSALPSMVAELQFHWLVCAQITFAEFKRAVQLLKGTLEQRLGCQSPARRLLLNTRLLQGFTSEYLTLATTGV